MKKHRNRQSVHQQSDIGLNMKSSRCSMRLLRKLTWRTSTRNGDGLTDMYRKVEDMNEIATVMNEEEFGYFLKSFEKKADLKSLSMISRRCQVVDTLCGLQSDTVLTVGQIKQLFDLAK